MIPVKAMAQKQQTLLPTVETLHPLNFKNKQTEVYCTKQFRVEMICLLTKRNFRMKQMFGIS